MNSLHKTISLTDFVTQKHGGDVLVIDVRTPAEADNEYYGGSVNMPLQEITAQKLKVYLTDKGCNGGEPIYMLCGSGQRAQKAVAQLIDEIDNPLLVIEGGINAMKQAGLGLQQGSGSVISLERQVRIAAGSLVVIGAVLGTWVAPSFYMLSAFVGAGLVFAGLTDTCGMAMLLARMPWNRAG